MSEGNGITALVPINQNGVAPHVQTYEVMPVYTYDLAKQRYGFMKGFVQDLMQEGKDFGVIPGTDKPTLLKPGAEKLTSFFGLTPKFVPVEKILDWMGTDHGGEPFFYYEYTAQMWRGDLLVAEAAGSCNSWESKYRWRWVNETDLPAALDRTKLAKRSGAASEFEFAIEKAETTGKYGKPIEYWDRFRQAIEDGTARRITKNSKSGREMAAWEIGSMVYRVPNEDIASQANTVLKMAQKRALIAATLIATNASEFFTQDVEDMQDIIDSNWRPETSPSTQKPTPAGKSVPDVGTTYEEAAYRAGDETDAYKVNGTGMNGAEPEDKTPTTRSTPPVNSEKELEEHKALRAAITGLLGTVNDQQRANAKQKMIDVAGSTNMVIMTVENLKYIRDCMLEMMKKPAVVPPVVDAVEEATIIEPAAVAAEEAPAAEASKAQALAPVTAKQKEQESLNAVQLQTIIGELREIVLGTGADAEAKFKDLLKKECGIESIRAKSSDVLKQVANKIAEAVDPFESGYTVEKQSKIDVLAERAQSMGVTNP